MNVLLPGLHHGMVIDGLGMSVSICKYFLNRRISSVILSQDPYKSGLEPYSGYKCILSLIWEIL